jgi:glycosyltransferase involved in cell wall biosynthesis
MTPGANRDNDNCLRFTPGERNRTLDKEFYPVGGIRGSKVRRIRVLHVVSTFQVKTDTKWLLSLLRHFDRRQCEPAIACMYGGGPIQEQFESLAVATVNWKCPAEADLRVVGRAYRYIRSGSFDVVHTHLLRADLYAGLAARLALGPAVVSTVYAIGAYRRDRRRRLDGMLDQLTRLWPDHLLAVSQAVKDDCVRRLRWPVSRISVVHTGIEPSEYGRSEALRRRIRSEWGIDETTPLMVTVARLSYEKGLPTLIDAIGRLAGRHSKLVAAIVGDGPMRAELAARIQASGLDGRVRLVGFRLDVPALLAAADLFCLPSYMEGLPNVLLEASAACLPVVATRVGGNPEVVVDGETGLLVPPGRADAMAEAIGRLLDDRTLARQFAHAGRRRIEESFSAAGAARSYVSLYESLVRGRQRLKTLR